MKLSSEMTACTVLIIRCKHTRSRTVDQHSCGHPSKHMSLYFRCSISLMMTSRRLINIEQGHGTKTAPASLLALILRIIIYFQLNDCALKVGESAWFSNTNISTKTKQNQSRSWQNKWIIDNNNNRIPRIRKHSKDLAVTNTIVYSIADSLGGNKRKKVATVQ